MFHKENKNTKNTKKKGTRRTQELFLYLKKKEINRKIICKGIWQQQQLQQLSTGTER